MTIIKCPYCIQTIDTQNKVENKIDNGKTIYLKCPNCGIIFEWDKKGIKKIPSELKRVVINNSAKVLASHY